MDPSAFALRESDREVLKARACAAIARELRLPFTEEERPVDVRGLGAFVTLNRQGRLRGCRGMLESLLPLHEVVEWCAVLSAFSDPRFEPVTADEMPDLEVEISVVGRAREVEGEDDIEVGRDGVLLEVGDHRGFLLPQVADRMDGDRQAFLEALCHKAGLPAGAWQRQDARLQAFPVVHF